MFVEGGREIGLVGLGADDDVEAFEGGERNAGGDRFEVVVDPDPVGGVDVWDLRVLKSRD